MTPLERDLIGVIRAGGPLSVADYMSACLTHPHHGYYTRRRVFGRAGDFVTAPEISQMFGELVGLSLAQSWLSQGAPGDAILVELGPGRGTMMHDMRRATAGVAGFSDLPVHLVETSAQLRAAQADRLGPVIHHNTVETLPPVPLYLVANEFFDALPVHQYRRVAAGWQEIQVGLQDGALGFGHGPTCDIPALVQRLDDTNEGDIVETCPQAAKISGAIARHIATHGGAALIIDYGDWRSLGSTVQAVHDHAPVDPLFQPGECDLTAHVDFEPIYMAAQTITASRLTPQGVFLERLGITNRARALAAGLSGDGLTQHIAAHRRLVHPDDMGQLFKVMGLAPSAETLPPGLEV